MREGSWACGHCGQVNSGWATVCGRCEVRRPDPPAPDPLPDPPSRLARLSDPATSHAAAANLGDLSARQHAVYRLLSVLGSATDEQLETAYRDAMYHDPANYPRQAPSGLRTRRSELVQRGYVRDTGTRQATRSGGNAIVWTTTTHPPKGDHHADLAA